MDRDLEDADAPDACVAGWCEGEDWCAVTCTMDVIANKWHPVVVLLLLRDGPLGFNALQERMSGVTGKVLSESLGALVDDGVVERRVVNEQPRRVEYSLTAAGEALEPVVVAMASWGDRYLTDGGFEVESEGGGCGCSADAEDDARGATKGEVGSGESLDRDERSERLAGRHAAAGYEFDE